MTKVIGLSAYRKQTVTGSPFILEYPGKISLADQPLVSLEGAVFTTGFGRQSRV